MHEREGKGVNERGREVGMESNKISSEIISMTHRTWEAEGRPTVKTMNSSEREIRLQRRLSAASAPLTNGQTLLTCLTDWEYCYGSILCVCCASLGGKTTTSLIRLNA